MSDATEAEGMFRGIAGILDWMNEQHDAGAEVVDLDQLLVKLRALGRGTGLKPIDVSQEPARWVTQWMVLGILVGMLEEPLETAKRHVSVRVDVGGLNLLIAAVREGQAGPVNEYEGMSIMAIIGGWDPHGDVPLLEFAARRLTLRDDDL